VVKRLALLALLLVGCSAPTELPKVPFGPNNCVMWQYVVPDSDPNYCGKKIVCPMLYCESKYDGRGSNTSIGVCGYEECDR
jgi:hypothetical protein